MKINNLKKSYNHNDWLLLVDIVIWACFGLKIACFIAFLMLMTIGLGKTIIGMINFFHK